MNEVMTIGVSDKLQRMMMNSGLTAEQGQKVLDLFKEYTSIAALWEVKAKEIVVTDITQTVEIQRAAVGRKIISRMRIDAEATRVELKNKSLREGKFIDAVANELKSLIAPIEMHLKAQENFVKIKEEREADERRIKAEALLKEQEEKEAADVEKARLEQEEADRSERERIYEENARLTREHEKNRKELEDERKKAEKERIAAEEKSNKELRAIEEKARKEREEIESKAAAEKAKQDRVLAEERAKALAIKEEKAQPRALLDAQITCPECGHKFTSTQSP
ncbi:MAG TPA: hypothetical protein ENH82_14160 [bacterium]|nr:hypothetical protein [bacterium]